MAYAASRDWTILLSVEMFWHNTNTSRWYHCRSVHNCCGFNTCTNRSLVVQLILVHDATETTPRFRRLAKLPQKFSAPPRPAFHHVDSSVQLLAMCSCLLPENTEMLMFLEYKCYLLNLNLKNWNDDCDVNYSTFSTFHLLLLSLNQQCRCWQLVWSAVFTQPNCICCPQFTDPAPFGFDIVNPARSISIRRWKTGI